MHLSLFENNYNKPMIVGLCGLYCIGGLCMAIVVSLVEAIATFILTINSPLAGGI